VGLVTLVALDEHDASRAIFRDPYVSSGQGGERVKRVRGGQVLHASHGQKEAVKASPDETQFAVLLVLGEVVPFERHFWVPTMSSA
jgi:hypothetical protein